MFKRFLSVVLAALIGAATPAVPAQAPSPAIERGLSVSAPVALPQLAQRLPDTIPPLYMLGGDDSSSSLVASFDSATDPFPSAVLSHSRGSLATMFDSTGKLTYAPNNLLTYSNTFSNATWVKSATGTGSAPIVTPNNATGPDGGANTASTVVFNVGAGTSSGDQSILRYDSGASSIEVSYLGAIYVKGSAGNKILLRHNGVVAYTLFTLTGGWDQLYTKEAGVAATTNFELGIRQGVNGTINSTITVQIAYAALSAVTYETTPRTADQVITTASAYYGPRIDYDPNTLAVKGLLIEVARTWVALWNRDFTNAAWVKTSVTAAKDQTGIDGVANAASSLTATGANGTVLQSITLASSQRATSAYVKRLVGSGAVSMTTDGGATWTDITSQLGAGSYVRATIPAQTVTNPSVGFKFATSGDSIAVDYFGNENGAFATSALYLTTASVARAADVVQFTGAALTAAQGSAASAFVEVGGLPTQAFTTRYLQYGAGSGILISMSDSSATTVYEQNTAASASTTAVAGSGSIATVLRAGVSWGSTGGRKLVANGGTVATDASNNELATGSVNIGQGQGTYINGWLRSFAIYNQRLPDATLQAKSVVGASYAANDNGIRYAFADNDNLPIHWRVAL